MLDRLIQLINAGENRSQSLSEEELHLAAAALLVHASAVDGVVDPAEDETLKTLLASHFELSAREVRDLLERARAADAQAVDLYGFTRVLTRELDQDGRQRIVEMMWEVVYADGQVHEFETNLVWRAAELLGVSSRDRIRLKKLVEARCNHARGAGDFGDTASSRE